MTTLSGSALEIRLQEFIAAASKTFSLCYWNVCFAEPATPGKTVSAHRVENGVGPRKPDHSLWLLKRLESSHLEISFWRSLSCSAIVPAASERFCDRI